MKNQKMIFIYALMFLIGLTFVCISSLRNTSEPPDALISRDYGFTATPLEGGMAFVSFAVEIENPNAELAACNQGLRLIWQDERGDCILSQQKVLPVIPGGETLGFCTNTTFSFLPSSLSVELISEDGIFIPMEEIDIQKSLRLTPWHFLMVGDTPTISGEIINQNPITLHQVIVTAVLKDDKGKITGGVSATVKHIGAKGNTPYAIFLDPRPGDQIISNELESHFDHATLSIAFYFQDLPLQGRTE